MGFRIAQRIALWEGIIFPGVEVSDPRFEYYEAKPRPSLEKYIHVAWLLTWTIPAGEELPYIVVPNPCIKLGARLGENTFLVHGPRTSGSIRKMSGKGMALGFDLVPGGFFPFSRRSVPGSFHQQVDHFGGDPGTFSQRYWIDSTYALDSRAPVGARKRPIMELTVI